MEVLTQEEIDKLLTAINADDTEPEYFRAALGSPIPIENFEKALKERSEPEEPYGIFGEDITMCRMTASKNGEGLLADIERKNREQGMGNYQIPNTAITLINSYDLCQADLTIIFIFLLIPSNKLLIL